ncbi:hypothetical protein [Lysobacter silvisoli]|uniref:Tetratricopeptide repeat protein n=1 Tax=Lysobacter silvisoli TaxID=2293254 RepID=A0A371JZD6_9GAMM|nr:hypothetical protein [Lysobacter silvisoli]RDZ27031.1 hypothetical protein DX914_12220 [Lysobacter silvisoli]
MRQKLPLILLLLLTAAIYWQGLSGPFLFDDGWNFTALFAWAKGKATWQEVVLGNGSLLLARPVAMASFLLTTWLGGVDPFSFKLGNLAVHLACGVLVWAVARRALTEDPRLAMHANALAIVAAAFWLLHPLQVSTVLYAVQRAAQLSTLFVLAAVWTYLIARRQLAQGATRRTAMLLFLLFPLIVVAGLLSKQNAAIAPLLCLVLELAYFRGQSASRAVLWPFFGLSLGLPAVLAAGLLAFAPDKLLGGYAEWGFTLGERLLTQPRALCDYLAMLLIPRSPAMGLYTDDFAVSTGLMAPPSTLAAILALLAISAAAIAVRKRAPTVFAGWFLFLAGHAVESGFLPLEMYYEHRNYLPSAGVMLALVALFAQVGARLRTNVLSTRQLGLLAAGTFGLVLAFATFGRVMVWQKIETVVAQGLRFHPQSLRANFDRAVLALQAQDYATHQLIMQHLLRSPDPRNRLLAQINLITGSCLKNSDADPADLDRLVPALQPQITIFEMSSLQFLADTTQSRGCGRISNSRLAANLLQLTDATPNQADSAMPKWRTRYMAADLYAMDRDFAKSEALAASLWEPSGHDIQVGLLLAWSQAKQGKREQAQRMIETLDATIKPYDSKQRRELAMVRSAL